MFWSNIEIIAQVFLDFVCINKQFEIKLLKLKLHQTTEIKTL